MSPVKYCVPRDTASALGSAYPLDCDNFGLLLARFVPHEAVRNEKGVDVILDHKGKEIDTIRGDWMRQVCRKTPTPAQREHQQALLARWKGQTEGASRFRMNVRDRLIVGLGGKGALEIGITLHHTTGLPHIPGSALKGLARSFILLTIAGEMDIDVAYIGAKSAEAASKRLSDFDEELEAGEVNHPLAEAYRAVFGTQGEAGACVFFDGVLSELPPNGSLFMVDVMTPHFSEYYRSSGGKAPHDADSPVPVNYITVNGGVVFDFAVGVRPGYNNPDIYKPARAWLRAGLQEMGVGAKTAAGYGVFAPPPKQG